VGPKADPASRGGEGGGGGLGTTAKFFTDCEVTELATIEAIPGGRGGGAGYEFLSAEDGSAPKKEGGGGGAGGAEDELLITGDEEAEREE
jgi:hypothetical protein